MSENSPALPPAVPKKKGLSTTAWALIAVGAVILLMVLLSVLAAVAFPAAASALSKAKQLQALTTARSMEAAITNFCAEYGDLPDPDHSGTVDTTLDTSGPDGGRLLAILTATESGADPQNHKMISFLMLPPATGGKNGLVRQATGFDELRDPWGNPYKVMIDYDFDESLTPPIDSGNAAPQRGRRALVYSLGPDGKGGAKAVRTW